LALLVLGALQALMAAQPLVVPHAACRALQPEAFVAVQADVAGAGPNWDPLEGPAE
jgi:hypothetical protein